MRAADCSALNTLLLASGCAVLLFPQKKMFPSKKKEYFHLLADDPLALQAAKPRKGRTLALDGKSLCT